MSSLVAPDVEAQLSQILSNLVLGENDVRKAAEKTLNEEWLAKDPGTVLIALAQLTKQSPDYHMRSFAAVLIRRLAFRSTQHASISSRPLAIFDTIKLSTLKTIEALLLDCIANEADTGTRNKIIDTATDWAEKSFDRHQQWPELQRFAAQYTQSPDPVHREIAFRLFTNVPRLILDQPVNEMVGVFERGLGAETPVVQLAALKAAAAFLTATDKLNRDRAAPIMIPILNTLPPLPPAAQAPFLQALLPLATSEPALFRPHLESLITFLPPLIHPNRIDAPTPTAQNPTPSSSPIALTSAPGFGEDGDAIEEARYAALELLITLTESIPNAVQGCSSWVSTVVRCCLEGMAEINDDVEGDWLHRDPSEEDDEDGYPRNFEQSLDRAACALGGTILPVTFQYVPVMLASPDWQQRHAGLMAMCSVAEGTVQFMSSDLGSVVALLLPLFNDPHPRLRHGACHCVGVLCNDLGLIIQEEYGESILEALIQAMHAPEARVHTHAAAALINFCNGGRKEIITPYLRAIVSALSTILRDSQQLYVQHQVFTTMAMVADAAQASFRPYFPETFPIALMLLKISTDKRQRTLRCRAMECASFIGLAVGKNTFKPRAAEFAAILLNIQNNLADDDEGTANYIISTWARMATTLKADFAPYLQYVMPLLLNAAGTREEMTVLGDEGEHGHTGDFETLVVDGQVIGIRTATVEEKVNAFENLVQLCAAMGQSFVDYVRPVLELCLPGLRYAYHESVKESSAMLMPMLIVCGKSILAEAELQHIFRKLLASINEEKEPGFLASLYKSVVDSMLVIPPNSAPVDLTGDFVAVTQRKLEDIGHRRKIRTDHLLTLSAEDSADEREDVMMLEELEDFALEEIGRLLAMFDPNHPLLVAVGSVRDLGAFPSLQTGYD